ncbi:MAG: diguanylate cyclase [Herbinix sp.]|jgi:diguanylate cyclase (GGDEF)-like protein|nr:diguanylate cyclase [Herbinix sp.]
MCDDNLDIMLDKLRIIDKMYDMVRLVNPTTKKILKYSENKLIEENLHCFEFWERKQTCNNCVSMRAYQDNETYVKIEYAPDKIFLVTSVPAELDGNRIVVELLKDATNSMVFENQDGIRHTEVYSMIECINSLALKDPLTGIYNRRYINEKLPVELINAYLVEQKIGIIMIDIDNFKEVNDTYGHITGDGVLKSFVNTISGCLKRESDWVARYGGEEFLVCLPGATQEVTENIAELMRRTVEHSTIRSNGHDIKVTASFGICCKKAKKGITADDIIDLADQKLYEAKNMGRNRVEV